MMTLVEKVESISGNLRDAYKSIDPETMLLACDLTTKRRDSFEFRDKWYYTADGVLYTIKEGKALLGITDLPQNLVLTHIDDAYSQLMVKKGDSIPNYIPPSKEAQVCFEHPSTVVIDLQGLKLAAISDDGCSYYVVDPRNPNKLNSQQKLATRRIFGPDEENYGKNMEMFAQMGKTPAIFTLTPGYVKNRLRQSSGVQYLARVSWLGNFEYSSSFNACSRFVASDDSYVCGVRKSVTADNIDHNLETLSGRNVLRNGALTTLSRK